MALSGATVFSIDCLKVTKGEIQLMKSSFTFTSILNGDLISLSLSLPVHLLSLISEKTKAPLNGFAGWFDVIFHGPIVPKEEKEEEGKAKEFHQEIFTLTTSPEQGFTHWRQALFYLDEGIQLQQDQQISGEIEVKNNGSCKRSTTVTITFTVAGGKPVSKGFEIR